MNIVYFLRTSSVGSGGWGGYFLLCLPIMVFFEKFMRQKYGVVIAYLILTMLGGRCSL